MHIFEVVGSMVEEVPFTELIQRPARTAARLAGTRALRLRRRDADDLVLMSADRAQQEGEVVEITARLLAGVLGKPGGADLVRQVLPTVLERVRLLPPAAVDELGHRVRGDGARRGGGVHRGAGFTACRVATHRGGLRRSGA